MINLEDNNNPPSSPFGVDGREKRVPSSAVLLVPIPPTDVGYNNGNTNSRPASTTRSRAGTSASKFSNDPSGKSQLIKLIRESKYDAAIEMLNSDEYDYDKTFLTEALATGVKLGINVPESIVAAFINKGADVNYQNPTDPMTILMSAIAGYDTRMANILLKLGAQFDLHDKYGEDAVHFAIYYGLPEVIVTIMDKLTNGGKNIAAYKEYATRVKARNKPPPLVYAIQQKKEDIAVILIDHGADVQSTDKKGVPVLYTAIDNCLFKVIDDLLSHNIDVSAVDPNGYSFLHAAIDLSYTNRRMAATDKGKEDAEKFIRVALDLLDRGAPIDSVSDLKVYNGATPLIICAQNENVEITKKLISMGANVNATDNKGKTALHYAAEEGNVEIIDLLLTANADSTTIDNQKWTPVYYAVDSKRVDALDHLLSKHVPIMVDKEVKPIILVCVKGDYDENAEEIPKAQQCLELLLNDKYAKVDINASSYGHKNTALIYAVKENKVKMAAYLLSKGCKIDLVDVDGKSAIHYATKQLLLPMVKLLIEKNADVTISDAENYTPLMICAAVKVKGEGKATPEQLLTNLEIAKLILQRQIKMSPRKLNIGDVELGRTALHMAVEHGFFSLVEIILDAEPDLVDCTDNKNDTPLIYAARSDGTMRDRGIKIANILIDRGAKIDQSGDLKRTALHVAAQNGFKSLVEKLVDKDANIEKVDTYGFTPLMMASRVPSAENYDTGKLIVELGADIMKIDYKNRTALHHAAKCGNESFAKYLLRQAESIQADILSLMDSKADTAIHQAARNKHKGVVNLLMDAKAALLENHESHIAEDNILKLLERAAEGKFEAFNRRIFIDMMRFNNDRAVYHGPSVFSFIVKTVTEIFTDVNFLFKLVQGRNSTKETDESHKTNADPSNTGRVHFDPNKHPLIEMALRFPTETHNIISSMAPVKSHPVLVRNFDFVASVEEDDFQVMGTMDNVPRPKDLNDDEDEEDDIKLADKTKREEEYLALHGNKDCFELWHNALVKKSFIRDTISVLNNVEVAEVSSYTIEIPFVSSMEFLEACVIISERTGQKDIFRHEVVKVAIEHAWYAYGLRYHSIHFALYISLLIINSACNYLFMQMSGNNDFGLVYINLVIVGFFCLYEVLQFFQDPIEYFTSFSNMFDLTAFVLLIAGNGLRLQNQTESDDSAALLAVGTVMLYGDFLFFLRPFKATGALIGMIEAIFWGIRYYLFILGIVLYGFSQALFILSYQNVNVTDDAIPGLEFTTPGTALLHAYTYMLGASSYPPNLTISNPPLATFLIAMLIFVTAIVLLNLLISLMSYIFGGVQDSADEEWRKKVCTTILDQFRIFKPRVQQYTHYLKRVQDTKKEKAEVKIESVLSELRDQFYPAIMNFDDHRHELYRMTRDESGYLKIVCDVCKLEVTGDGHDLLYNCKSCVYSTHLHCALPMIASDAKVQKLSATVNLKLKNVLSELRDQNYPATMCCSSHDITHTLTRSLIRTSTYNPMFCGLCHRSVNPHDDDDMFYECTESDCAFHGHMKCCVDSNQKGETRIVALEAKLDLILEKLNKRTYH